MQHTWLLKRLFTNEKPLKKSVKAFETMIDVLDGLVPLEAKQQSVGKGTLFEIVFEGPEDKSKKVTVFWYTEMDGTGQKDSVDYSDDEMAVVLSGDSEEVYLVDMAEEITTPHVYNTSVIICRVKKGTIEDSFGIWTGGKSGIDYVNEIRDYAEQRLEERGIEY